MDSKELNGIVEIVFNKVKEVYPKKKHLDQEQVREVLREIVPLPMFIESLVISMVIDKQGTGDNRMKVKKDYCNYCHIPLTCWIGTVDKETKKKFCELAKEVMKNKN